MQILEFFSQGNQQGATSTLTPANAHSTHILKIVVILNEILC